MIWGTQPQQLVRRTNIIRFSVVWGATSGVTKNSGRDSIKEYVLVVACELENEVLYLRCVRISYYDH